MSMRIAVIDDDPDFQRYAASFLERAGFSVTAITSGLGAVEEVARCGASLVVLDGVLPGVMGPDVARALREDERTAWVEILFLSAFFKDLGAYRTLTEQLGVRLVLRKPLDGEELVEHVRSILETPAGRPEAPAPTSALREAVGLGRALSFPDLPELHFRLDPDADDAHAAVPELAGPVEQRDAGHDRLVVAGNDLDVPIVVVEPSSELPGLEALRRDYMRTVPAKIAQLKAGIDALETGDREPLRIASHRLRGTAGTYGFLQASEIAASIEEAVRADAPADAAALHAYVSEIEAALSPREASAPAAAPAEGKRHARRGHGRKLLVVTAAPELARSLSAGATADSPRTADSAHAALELLATYPADVIFLDAETVPGWAKLCAEVSAQWGWRSPALVLLGVDATTEERVAATRAGCEGFLSRPCTAQDLAQAAERLRPAEPVGGVVVIADDDPDIVAHLAAVVKGESTRAYQCVAPEALLGVLERRRPDVLLLDLSYGRFDGADLCRAIRADARYDALSILMVTAHGDGATRRRCFRAGADDFITKPFVTEELAARVHARLERAALLRASVGRDADTGLPNRRRLDDLLATEIDAALHFGKPGAVALVTLSDRDNLRSALGPAAEAASLRHVARHLQGKLPPSTLVGRTAAATLAVHLRGADADGLARALREALASFKGARLSGLVNGRRIAVQLGLTAVVAGYPADGRTPDQLLGACRRAASGCMHGEVITCAEARARAG